MGLTPLVFDSRAGLKIVRNQIAHNLITRIAFRRQACENALAEKDRAQAREGRTGHAEKSAQRG
ncbi:hypothetical protein MOV61_19045 [Neorhizobium sp. BETTINA12A]|uniref:hypothetical protein n=1 Tax=Neorhizobium sp. BETTINA12A TaxID=2908924 RepID=UPI001FF4A1BE|nr:hypothetical protein [Neorhizobium sp. BETTINA12A]MCJ9752820.1 hypothetical protein [Neorhizobium sp. BETTINA12A]